MILSIEQTKAVETINKNVIVNAGAGTGKTEVLTRRYIEILRNGKMEKGQEISGIVAITFTIKAANEMKERIRNILSKEEELAIFMDDINDAQISTIHSFCTKIIREYSYYLDLDPNFEILDQTDRDNLLKNIVREVLLGEEAYEDFLAELFEKLSINEPDILIQEIINLYNNIKTSTNSLADIKKITIENLDNLYKINNINEIKEELIHIKENMKLRKGVKLLEFIQTDDNINNLDEIDIFDKLNESINIKNIEYLKDLINKQLGFREYENKYLYISLFDLLEKIEKKFMDYKKILGKFDFNDLEHLALELLNKEEVRTIIQDNIKYLMVDEYQDSNDIQKEIFYKICSRNEILDRNNLFVVGDPKQSIYGFRGANIHVFNDTKEDVLKNGDTITFADNYRSNRMIIEGVNIIYKNIMKDRYISLNPKKEENVQNKILYFNNENKKDKDYEPDNIANFIADKINSNVDKQYGDFTLLFRTKSDQALFENHFMRRNIPFYVFDSLGFYKSEEVLLIREILKLIKNNNNNFSYNYILKSMLYNCTDKELSFVDTNINLKVNQSIEDLNKKIEELRQYREDKIFNFLFEVYKKFNLIEIYNYSEKNIQKQGNLYKLLEIARDFDNSNLFFEDFLYFLIDNEIEDNLKQVENENSNVVKLMTIHGSKGLGFNDVIIPYINKQNKNDNNLFKYSKENGILIKFKLANLRLEREKDKLKKDNDIENDNIYYVAMTRAKNNLVLGLSGIKSGYKKKLMDEIKVLEENNLIEIINYDEYTENTNYFKEYLDEKREFKYINKIDYEMEGNVYLNISKVLDYYYTPKEFYNTKNYYESEIPNITLGNILHKYAELYEGENLDIKEILREFGLINLDINKLKKYIDNIHSMYNFTEKSFKEIPFNYKINNIYFTGIIDRIEISGSMIRVIDYKFSYLKEEELENKYWIQLVLYGLVCEKLYPNKSIEIIIKNIRENYQLKIDFNEKIKEEFFNKIKNYIDNL